MWYWYVTTKFRWECFAFCFCRSRNIRFRKCSRYQETNVQKWLWVHFAINSQKPHILPLKMPQFSNFCFPPIQISFRVWPLLSLVLCTKLFLQPSIFHQFQILESFFQTIFPFLPPLKVRHPRLLSNTSWVSAMQFKNYCTNLCTSRVWTLTRQNSVQLCTVSALPANL